jgi:hypothetical protein
MGSAYYSAYADVNIWSGNKKEKSCWRDMRRIGEIREKVGEETGEKMGGKMGEERCEDERETAINRIRSPRQNAQRDENNLLKYFKSPHLSVWLQWSQIRDPWLWRGETFRALVKS